jgi:membrane protein
VHRRPRRPGSWEERLGKGRIAGGLRFLKRDIWHIEIASMSGFRAWATRVSRVILIAVRGFFRDRCNQQAAALTYITIFSLVPLLAFGFATAKGLGAYEMLREQSIDPFLDRTFGTAEGGSASSQGLRQTVDRIFETVDQSDLKALGTFGLILLLYLVVKMLGAVERSLNEIWGVKRARSLVRKVTDYMAIVVVTPIFLITGAGLSLMLRDIAPDSLQLGGGRWAMIPAVAPACIGMAFVLLTLPNTSVRISSALVGGVIAGLLWQLVQFLHVEGQLQLAGWNPIYRSFAALPLLLLWIYLSWVILLLGAEFAYAHQNESIYTSIRRAGTVDQSFREALAPRLAARVTHAFLHGHRPPDAAQLASETSVAPRLAMQVLEDLAAHGLLARTSETQEEGYLPGRDPSTITMLDLAEALRSEPGSRPPDAANGLDASCERERAALDEQMRSSPHNRTLAELARMLDAEHQEVAHAKEAAAGEPA